MAVLNIAILATLLPTILAVPHYGGYGGHMGHGPVKGSKLPSGFPTGFPHPSGVPGGPHSLPHPHPHPSGAPFPAPGNGTSGAATGSGTGTGSPTTTAVSPPESISPESVAPGPVTISSTLYVIPQPVSTDLGGESPESTGAPGESPATGVPASPSGASGSGSSPSSAPGSGSGSGNESGVCGPATVTITMANTVTVTVPASPASGAPESGAPESAAPSQAPIQSQPALPSIVSAPFPMSNSSMSVGPTGTGTGVASTSVLPISSPIVPSIVPVVSTSSSPAAPVVSTSSTPAIPVISNSAAPVVPIIFSTSAAPVVAPTVISSAAPAPVVTSSTPIVPVVPQTYTTPAPASSVAPVSDTNSATPTPSSPPKSTGGVKARGLLYGSLPAAQAFDMSNIGWCYDWDSSVMPAVGKTQGSVPCTFVPQLWSDADVHTSLWAGNSAGHSYAMAFNEPDICGGGGACMSVSQSIASWGTYMNNMDALLVTPATTNDLTTKNVGLDYMTQFLAGCTDCKFQAIACHWYGNAWDINDTPGGLEPTIQAYQKLQKQYNIPELWVSEMAPNQAPTTAQMDALLSYLDSSDVKRYAFNGLDTGTGQQLTGELADCYAS